MSDLISRSALLKKIQFRIHNDRVLTDIVDSCVKITRRIIEEAPSVDAVSVVRCKDCKHYDSMCGECYGQDFIFTEDGSLYVGEEDFCSYGERRADGNNE